MPCLGRNGGHLTARNFNGFGGHATTWGISDAVRAVHIEEHVVDVITSLVKEAGLKDEVDLVEDVRTILFSTKEEEVGARDEYEAAKAAGINVSVAEWLTEGETEKVRQLLPLSWPSDDNWFRRCTERDIRQSVSQETPYGRSSSSLTYSDSRRTRHQLYH
jgi:hypothetical protein